MNTVPPRNLLSQVFNGNPVMIRFIEDQAQQVTDTADTVTETGGQVETQRTAPVVTFAPSGTFDNERIVTAGTGLAIDNNGSLLTLRVNDTVPLIVGGRTVEFVATGNTTLVLPETGTVATTGDVADVPRSGDLMDYADDTAAAAGGVPVGGFYRTASVVKVRVA